MISVFFLTSCWPFSVCSLCQSLYSAWTCPRISVCQRVCLVDEFVEPILSYNIFLRRGWDTHKGSTPGEMDQFNPEQKKEWPQHVERLDQFFKANDLTGDEKATKRRATFLTVIGPGPYKLLCSLYP